MGTKSGERIVALRHRGQQRVRARGGARRRFEKLVGCYGGGGGLQTSPFVLYPAGWGETPPVVGAEQLHRFLRQHVG